MGLLKNIKDQISKSGQSKSKILFVKSDTKRRIRFLSELEDGIELLFHDSFSKGINCLCNKELRKPCELCDDDDLRHRKLFAWSVFDYDTKEVKILLYAANNFSPVPALISLFENYSTILDRDYVIERKGSQMKTSYTVIPMDKAKFRNKKVKPLDKKEMLKIISKAFPYELDADIDDDEDEDSIEIEDVDEDYNEQTTKELYKLCKERNITVEPKKKKDYYIDLLETYDINAEEDGDEDDDDYDW